MKSNIVQIAIALWTIVFASAFEEMLPKIAGVGFPLLMMSSVYFASKREMGRFFAFAVVAGAAEDAICSLPFATSIAFFVMIAAFIAVTGMVASCCFFAYPLYQIWLGMWLPDMNGAIFNRFLLSIPVGALTAGAAWLVLGWIDKRGAVDEAE